MASSAVIFCGLVTLLICSLAHSQVCDQRTSHTCQNGHIVSRCQLGDNSFDCNDGSDEFYCLGKLSYIF